MTIDLNLHRELIHVRLPAMCIEDEEGQIRHGETYTVIAISISHTGAAFYLLKGVEGAWSPLRFQLLKTRAFNNQESKEATPEQS